MSTVTDRKETRTQPYFTLRALKEKQIDIEAALATESGVVDTRTIWQKLADMGRQLESEPCDLPADLAANHDYYLQGLAKHA